MRRAVLVEQLLGVVALQPLLEQVQMLGGLHGQGHLVGAEGALNLLASTTLGPVQPLGVRRHNHGPHGTLGVVVLAGVLLDGLDFLDDGGPWSRP